MEWLRDGLKELREVPPHGLSNDRLRDRLLGSSLAPVAPRSAPWWTWAWAPVAAAAIAVVILPRLRPAPTPTLILNPGSSSTSGSLSGGPSSFDGPVALNGDQPKALDPRSAETIDADALLDREIMDSVAASFDGSITRSVRNSTDSRSVGLKPVSRDAKVSRKSVAPPATPVVEATPGAELTAMRQEGEDTQASLVADLARDLSSKTAAVLPSPPSDPLVLLAPEIDAHTGAVAATEVASTVNLSIGG